MTRAAHLKGVRRTPKGRVLVSGAGIAGPTPAYWLTRYGYAVTGGAGGGTWRCGAGT